MLLVWLGPLLLAARVGGTAAATCDLKRIDAATYEPSALRQYLQESETPLLLENAVGRWRALQRWSDRGAFLRAYGGVALPRMSNGTLNTAQEGPVNTRQPSEWTISTLVDAILTDPAAAPFLFEAAKAEHEPLATGVMAADLGPVEALEPLGFERHVLSIGGAGAGLPAHKHAAGWLALVAGRKRWSLLGPEAMPIDDTYGAVALQSAAAWSESSRASLRSAGLLECTQLAGETVYVPHLWWHATVNLDDLVIGVGAQAKTVTQGVRQDRAPLLGCAMTNNVLGLVCDNAPEGQRCTPAQKRHFLQRALELEPLNPKYVMDFALEILNPHGPAPPDIGLAIRLVSGQAELVVGLHEAGDVRTADAVGILAKFSGWLRQCLAIACVAAEQHLAAVAKAVAVSARGEASPAPAPTKWKGEVRKALRRLSMASKAWEG